MTSDAEPDGSSRQLDAKGRLTPGAVNGTIPLESGMPALAVTVEELRTITDALPALISFFDAEHICRFANKHHSGWYGRTPEQLAGLHMREFLGDAAYESRKPQLDRVAAGQQVSFDAKVPHLDGTWRDAAIRYVPRMGAEGFEGMHVLVFDVAVQHHRFHSVFDGTAVGFWVIDLPDILTLFDDLGRPDVETLKATIAADPAFVRRALDTTMVLDINSKTSEMFGMSPDGARGQPLGKWCPDAALPAFTDNLLAFLSDVASFEAETVMSATDGRMIDVLLTCAFAKNAPGETAVVIGTTDITERVAREKLLARAQADLAHAARVATLGELMASIAHEVNQPLAAVVTNGNAALRWLNRPEPDILEAKEAIQRMVEEGTRASEIISRTRAMAVKGESRRTRFCVNLMIEETVAIVRRQVAALGAELTLRLSAGLPEIVADRIQMQQVAINLIINAAQAMADQPLGERLISISSGISDGAVAIEVADTGPGFDSATAARLFEAFYTTKDSGMGMGLSVTKSILEAHGGTILAGPVPGGGASFKFTVPLGEALPDEL